MPETKEHSSAAAEELERWQKETLEPSLTKRTERKKSFQTVSLKEVDRLYTPADTEDIEFTALDNVNHAAAGDRLHSCNVKVLPES